MYQLCKQFPNRHSTSEPAVLQRKCACGDTPGLSGECAECQRKQMTLQRQAGSQAAIDSVPPAVCRTLQSPGQPLPAEARSGMEARLGHDFSHVRIHADTGAAESARAVNALAYTVGRDIVFGTGQYSPGTVAGERLLAHELTHVTQQVNAPLSISPFQSKFKIGPVHDSLEREADRVADTIPDRPPVPVIEPSGRSILQRAPITRADYREAPVEGHCRTAKRPN